MSLALGELVGRVVIESTAAESKIATLMRLFRELGANAEGATAGTTSLDRRLMGVASAATKAAQGLDRTSAAARVTASTEEKAAAAATAQARAVVRLTGVMEPLVGLTAREQQAQLRLIASQERLNAIQATGTATTRQLASAQASLIGAQQGVVAAQKRAEAAGAASAQRMVAVGKKMSHAITLPVLAAAAVSIKVAMDFEQATNVYVTAAGESEKNLGVIRDGIKKTAVETGTSIKNLTDAEYLVEKAGLRGANGLLVLNAAAKGAREENAQLADVVQAMTSVMASYHLGADKSVQVMNALKTGAGQAKVSMEDFSRALSTVIPIASANKISIEQVFGAYATLTQHGTTANESTLELSATIRALAAPNRVAQNQMQQLGLTVNDVTKNIGKRGLTGTIDLLVDAITHHMGPAGLVLQKAFNQSKTAGQDVRVMIEQMSPAMAKLANRYLQGKISLEDWRKSVKALPAPQAALLQQFAVLANKANGFNSLLRAGDPAAQTFTSALKKMAGGAIGLNTILQLSGENMAGFKDRADEVGKSLHNTSKDVEGWASTAKLSATNTARLKQEMHVLAIDAGAELLPMFDGLVDHLESTVHWFGNLSHTQKEMLGWSIGVLAAIGPVLGIGGRLALLGRGIGGFVGGTTTRLATFAGATEASALRIATAMRGMTAALAGAGIGLAIGSITRNSSNATKAIGALGSTAVGAAIGFGAGGPLGAAIGGLAGGLTSLATAFLGAGHAAKSSVKPTDDYTKAILADSDAVGKNTRELIKNDLQKMGLYDAALKLGISQKTLTDYAMGNTHAMDLVNAAQARVFASVVGSTNANHELTKTQRAQNDASEKLTAGLGDLSTILKVNQHAADNLAAADGKVKRSTGQVGSAADTTAGKLSNLNIKGTGLDAALTKLAKQHKINVNAASATNQITGLRTALDLLYAAILHPPKPPVIKGPSIPGVTVPGLIGAAKAGGGDIVGPGPRGVDSVLTPSAPGEWMATTTGADLLRRVFGSAGMKAINMGRMPAVARPPSLTAARVAPATAQAGPSLHAGNVAEALHGMRIVIDAGSVGTLTGFVDSRVDGTLGRVSRTPAARQSRVEAFGRP